MHRNCLWYDCESVSCFKEGRKGDKPSQHILLLRGQQLVSFQSLSGFSNLCLKKAAKWVLVSWEHSLLDGRWLLFLYVCVCVFTIS